MFPEGIFILMWKSPDPYMDLDRNPAPARSRIIIVVVIMIIGNGDDDAHGFKKGGVSPRSARTYRSFDRG